MTPTPIAAVLTLALVLLAAQERRGTESRFSVSLGGHGTLTLYEYTSGTRTYTDSNSYHQEDPGARSSGMTSVQFTGRVTVQAGEHLSLVVAPRFDGVTGVAPQLGVSIGDTDATFPTPSFTGFEDFALRYCSPEPWSTTVTAGMFYPRFTLEYGAQLFRNDDYHASTFATNPWLGQMYGIGLELQRTFMLGPVRVPVYLYALNGAGRRYLDNNETPEALLHIEPGIGPVTFCGSLLGGFYDTGNEKTVIRWSYGVSAVLGPFDLRAEAAHGQWEGAVFSQFMPDTFTAITSWSDAEAFGCYAKVAWRYKQRFRALLHACYTRQEFVDNPLQRARKGFEQCVTLSPGIQVFLRDLFTIQAQVDVAWWERYMEYCNVREELDFYRVTLGWRVAF
jgi:hypothetical protein